MTPSCTFIVALAPEARPLIDHFRLKHQVDDGPFQHFAQAQNHLWVSGIGKVNAAACTAWAAAQAPTDVWINVGICGHADAALGSALLIHQCTDAASGQVYYPPIAFKSHTPSSTLRSVDVASEHYPDDCALDMEASGFYATAQRFASAELVHSLKAVSDNRQQALKTLDLQRIRPTIEGILPQVDDLHSQLCHLASHLGQQPEAQTHYQQLLEQWHFSSTQKSQLKRLIERHHALDIGVPRLAPEIHKNSKAVIHALRHSLQQP